MLKLKLQNFGHLMQRADSLEKTLMLGKIEGRRRRGQQRMRWLDGINDLMDMSLRKLQEIVKTMKPGMLQSMRLQRVGHDLMTEQPLSPQLWSMPLINNPVFPKSVQKWMVEGHQHMIKINSWIPCKVE